MYVLAGVVTLRVVLRACVCVCITFGCDRKTGIEDWVMVVGRGEGGTNSCTGRTLH